MEFVFGNSGKGYGLLYQRNPKNLRDEQISEYIQKINDFNVDSGEELYTYKVVSDGVSFTAIFSLYAHDNSFGRGAFYNHVKWHEFGRKDFLEAGFLDGLSYTFASQYDIISLRETGELALTDRIAQQAETAMLNKEALCNVLHTLLSDSRKKIVITSDSLDDDSQATSQMRGYVKQIFSHLPVDLRATTSFVTGCDLDAFVASEYRLTVVLQSSVKKRSSEKFVVISANDATFTQSDEWIKYIQWIVGLNQQTERDKFFTAFEGSVGKGEINALGNLLDFHKKYISPPKVETPKPKPIPTVTETKVQESKLAPKADVIEKPSKQATAQAQVASKVDVTEKPKQATAQTQAMKVAPKHEPQTPSIVFDTLSLKDGQYKGGIFNGKPHGIGTIKLNADKARKFPEGYSYVGCWNDGLRHGWGALVSLDGSQEGWRIGWWENGEKSMGFYLATKINEPSRPSQFGNVLVSTIQNYWYIGTLNNNFPNGWGAAIIWAYTDHKWYDWYIGQWKNGTYDGWGVYRNALGKVIVGTWENGNLVKQD